MKVINTFLFLFVLLIVSKSYSQELSTYSSLFSVKYYQDDTEITRKEFKELLLGYDESAVYWKKKATNETLFYVAYVPTLGAAFWFGTEAARDNGDTTTPALVGLGGLIISSIFLEGAAQNSKKAILTYNKQFDGKETSYRLVPTINQNGLGLALKF